MYWLQSYNIENANRQKADLIRTATRHFNCYFAELDAFLDPFEVRTGWTNCLSRICQQKQIPHCILVHFEAIRHKYSCSAQSSPGSRSDDKVYRTTCHMFGLVPGIRRTLPQRCAMGHWEFPVDLVGRLQTVRRGPLANPCLQTRSKPSPKTSRKVFLKDSAADRQNVWLDSSWSA